MAKGFWIKTGVGQIFDDVRNFYVKTGISGWAQITDAWVKTGLSTWSKFWEALMTPTNTVELLESYTGTDSATLRLQGKNYKWVPNPQTLKYYFRWIPEGGSTYYIGASGSSGDTTSNPVTSTTLPGTSSYITISPSGSNFELGKINRYYFEVRATGASGSVYSSISQEDVKIVSPKAPTLAFTVLSSTSVSITITSASFDDYYATNRYILYTYDGTAGFVYSGGGRGGFGVSQTTTRTLTGLVLGRNYTVYVLPVTGFSGTTPSNYSGYPGIEAYLSGVTTGSSPVPTITSLTASAPNTPSQQLVTVTVNWSSTNQASYFLNVFQAQVANYLDYGTTETSSSTSDSGSNFNVYSGASATISLTVYGESNQAGNSATQTITYTPPIVPVYTVNWNGNGGSSGNEGIPWSFTAGGSVTVPSVSRIGYTFVRWTDTPSGDYTYTTTGGTFSPPSQNITMYARWQINVCTVPNVIGMTEINASNALNNAGFLYEYTYYVNTSNASLNGTVQSSSPGAGTQPGCATNVDLYIYNYVAETITYGDCTPYGSPYYSTSGYDCYGNYSYAYTDNYYSQRRQILSNGTWNGSYDYSCGNTSVRTYGSFSQVNGQCGYSPPAVTPEITSGPFISWASGNNFTLSATASNATNLEFQVQFANDNGGPALSTQTFFFGASSGGGTTGAQSYSWARTRVRANNSSTGLSSSFSGYTGWA